MTDLEKYQTDHLILLVGGNPLPNYVAARLLRPKCVTLLHSQGTQRVAGRLKQRIEACDAGCQVALREVNESRARSIYNGVRDALDEDDPVSVGLHYTGGTKAMAVHAWRAASDWAGSNNAEFVASYLNARGQRLMIDDPEKPAEVYVGDLVELSLQEMLDLHGWTLKQAPCQQPLLPRTAQAIARAYVAGCDLKTSAWQHWKTAVLYPACKREGEHSDRWRSAGDLKKAQLDWPAGGALDDVTLALREELRQDGARLDIGAAFKQAGLSEPEDFCKWLDGLWLEHYTLDVLRKLSHAETKPNAGQVFQGVNPETDRKIEMDLDVAALVGYQLFAFSCGTILGKGARAQLKHKLFEAMLRARQLGGDQARVALISVYDDPDGLQSEARQQIDPDNQTQIRVFGCRHLAELGRYLEHWIGEQRRD